MRRTILAISAAAAMALCFPQGEAPAQSRDPGMAPEIAVSDWINGDDRVTLAHHRGDVVLLEFWSSH
jgi:hypothetical protein